MNKILSPFFKSIMLLCTIACITACNKKKIATGPAYTYQDWPYEVPARTSDRNNENLFLMSLGKVETSLADGKYNAIEDKITLCDGTEINNWYKDSLGVEFFSPIDKTIFPLPPSGMCTWYYYYQHINEDEVKLNARWINENLLDYGARYLQIDDGWQKEREDGGHGSRDWTGTDQAFPSGMDKLADYIREQGLVPGIWIAPHGQSNDSVVMANPGVFIFADDSTSASETWEGKWLLDPTSDRAHDYFYKLFDTMVKWGYDYFKIDGQPIVVREYQRVNNFMNVPGSDNQELYRSTLNTIRKAIGPERYLLGCWGIPQEGIGIMDGSRTGGDVVLGWSGFDVALMPTMRYYYQHNIAWYTDPDVMMLRQPLTIAQAQVWASLQGLTGQALMTSDRLPDLSDERIDILKKVFPAVDIRPIDLFPSEKRKTLWDLKINHLNRQYDVVGLFNFGEEEIKQEVLNFDEIGLSKDAIYHVFDFWNNEYLGAWEKAVALEVQPTGCRVLSVVPDNGDITIVSTNRHITQGWIDLEKVKYDEDHKTIEAVSNVIAGDSYQVHFAFPRGKYYKISKVKINGLAGAETSFTNHQGWATLTIRSKQTRELKWSVSFEQAYSYKYETRAPGRLRVEAMGPDAARISWGAQYYLNSGYQVYLDGKLMGYSPATYFTLNNLDPKRDYKVEVRTVWKDGETSKAANENNRNQILSFNLNSLLPSRLSLLGIKPVTGRKIVATDATIAGKVYSNCITAYPGSEYTYDLKKMFSVLNVGLALVDNSGSGNNEATTIITVEGDGKILFRSKKLKKGDKPLIANINIKGVSELKIKTYRANNSSSRRRGAVAYLIDPVITK